MSLFAIDEQNLLLICGEGIEKAIHATSYCLGQQEAKIKRIYNFGVCGCLEADSNYTIDTIYSISSVYAYSHLDDYSFRSFASQDSQSPHSCISTPVRILNENQRTKLNYAAALVDRELWGIAFSAKTFGLPYYAFKLISDFVKKDVNCFEIQNKALEYSQKLFQHWMDYKKQSLNEHSLDQQISSALEESGLHLTQSLKDKLYKEFKKLQILNEEPIDSWVAKFNSEIQNENLLPKQKAKFLLKRIEDTLNPHLRL